MPGIPGGCPNVMEQYAGTGGRKPKYCCQTVDGVPHTRYTALRVREGKLTLPTPGSGPDHEPAPDRPVSYARASIDALGGELRDQLAAHQACPATSNTYRPNAATRCYGCAAKAATPPPRRWPHR